MRALIASIVIGVLTRGAAADDKPATGAASPEALGRSLIDGLNAAAASKVALLLPSDDQLRAWFSCPKDKPHPQVEGLATLRRELTTSASTTPKSERQFVKLALEADRTIDKVPKGKQLTYSKQGMTCTLTADATKADYELRYSADKSEHRWRLKVWTFGGRAYLFDLKD